MTNYMHRTLYSLQKPIDLVLVGLGFMGFGFLSHVQVTPGLRIVLVITRDPHRTVRQLKLSGVKCEITDNPSRICANAERGIVSVWHDYTLIRVVPSEVVVEMTGDVAYGASVAIAAIDSGKHLATMNVELQATLGSPLLRYATDRGLLVSDAQGDQPGSLAALIDEVRLFGFRPIMAGNIKGYLDRYATPDTIEQEAAKRGLSLKQTTAFTDGTKIALEMSLVANYCDMRILTRGMHGYQAEHVEDVLELFDWNKVPDQGCVDYIIGDLPPGIFVVAEHLNQEQRHYLKYLKLGPGPRYLLYRPYHLCHLEAPITIAKLSLFNEVTINNSCHPQTTVVAYAKRDLKAGELADGIGGYCCYGMVDNLDTAGIQDMVPIGLIKGAIMKKAIKKDSPIYWDQVELPENMAVKLWGRGQMQKAFA
jgi:predicted homoserine dehydrogenase-like protein